ncbi:MAG: ComEC/Rec2 family competence protein, partial [Dehalococcoidia bacterium]
RKPSRAGGAGRLPEPEAALASGLLMGRDDALSEDVTEAFRRSGLAHIVAVSGANVVVVTAIVFAAISPLVGRNRALLPAGLAVVAYVFLAGAGWSIIRAAIMACIYLGGEYAGRARSSLPALAVTALLITAARPAAAFDVGFQLSLAATAGLIMCGPWARYALLMAAGPFGRTLLPRTLFEVLSLTLSATLATLPVSWAVFGRISLAGPLANALVEPLFAIALLVSGATAAFSVASPTAGWLVGLIAFYPLHYMVWTAETISGWEMAAVSPGRIGSRWAILACALFGTAAWQAYRRLPPDVPRPAPLRWAARARLGAALVLGLGLVANVACLSLLPIAGPGSLRIVVLDVGQGDAILLTTPHGTHVLVDGGPSGLRLAQELGRVLPHWRRRIDAVVLTHPQEDHVAGLRRLFELGRAGTLLDSGAEGANQNVRATIASAPSRQIVGAGRRFTLDGVLFEFLWPPLNLEPEDVNEASVAIRVTYAGVTVLLTGDLEGRSLGALADSGNAGVDILKVPHHGSATTPAWFFARADPELALISVGADNRFGHPAPGTLKALSGALVLRTDLDGRLTVEIGEQGVRVGSEARPTVTLPVGRGPRYGDTRTGGQHEPAK